MRLIGTLSDEKKGLAFSFFLHKRGITHQLELQPNTDWGSVDYGTNRCKVWIYDEDQFDESLKWYHLFLENSQDPTFQIAQPSLAPLNSISTQPSIPSKEKRSLSESSSLASDKATLWEKQPMGWITRFFLAACCLLFLATQLIKSPSQTSVDTPSLTLFDSPVEKALLYDYPYFYQLIDQFIQLYGYETLQNPQNASQNGTILLQKINHTPFWTGFYNLALKEGFSSLLSDPFPGPLFEKIQQGQVWRVFSPVLLHGDIFHLFFNMLWLMVIGKQIEQRLQPVRYLLLIFILGILSNTAQYLMSGSNFIGFSGILCGMLTFIWMRQKNAPWEGYQLDHLTFLFMFIFIGGMAAIQILSFFLEKSMGVAISPNIANMAHLAGAAIGLALGKLNFFKWRHS